MAYTGFNRSAGFLVLAIWLIIQGISAFVPFTLPMAVMPALALIAGVLILVGK